MKKVLFICLVLFSVESFAKGLKIEVGRAGSSKSKVAFSTIVGVSRINKQMLMKHIAENLKFSTYFDVLNTKTTGALTAAHAKKLYSSGIEFLVTGSASSTKSSETVQFKVYMLKTLKIVLNKTYVNPASKWREVGNKFSDDFMYGLTGKRSIFNTKLAVTTDKSDKFGKGWKELYVMDWNGKNPRRETHHNAITMSPNWSSGGNQIVYSAITKQPKTGIRSANLYIYDFKHHKRSMLSARPGINSGGAFFPDGRSLVMTLTQEGIPDIFRIGLNGKVLDRYTRGPGRAMNVEPSISPDGTKLAYSSDKGGQPMLYVMDLKNKRKKPIQLTLAGRYNSAPGWSPDGKTLVFAGWNKKHFDIFTINIDRTSLTKITEKRKANGMWSNNESPSFSPDGRFISFISDRTGRKQVFTVKRDGTHLTNVTKDRHNYYHVKWSPFLR